MIIKIWIERPSPDSKSLVLMTEESGTGGIPARSITGAITARTRKSVRVHISTGNFKIFRVERSEIP
jgi:hypothetical protein